MIACRPIRNSKKGAVVSLWLMLMMPLCLYLSQLEFVFYGAVLQFVGFISLALGIICACRYVLCEHQYMIYDKNNGKSDFSVVRISGKNSKEVFRISFDCYIGMIKKEKEYKKELREKFGEIKNRVDFSVNLNSPTAYTAVFEINSQKTAVTFEPDSVFYKEMEKRRRTKENE